MGKFFETVKGFFVEADKQAWLFDSTTYCRVGGLDPRKIVTHDFAGMLIQTGRGDYIAPTLQDQIDVAEELELEWAGWHIPDPRDGTMRFQAELVHSQPRMEGRLLIGDLEPRERGDYSTMVNERQANEFLTELADVSGRASWGYSNPNILLYYYGMPEWVYNYNWWIAQYPSTSYKYFEDFLKHYAWRYPSYFQNDERFIELIKVWQWTQWGDAQFYYASTTLPGGGSGIKSGDLDVGMMTKEEMIEVLKPTGTTPPPPVDPPGVLKRLDDLENTQGYILAELTEQEELNTAMLAAITDLVEYDDEVHDQIIALEQRVSDLEGGSPDPHNGAIKCKVGSDSNCSVFSPTTYDKACPGQQPSGKPLFETKKGVMPKNTEFWIYASFKFSCKDNALNPWVLQSGGAEYGVVSDGEFKGYFVPRKKFDILG